MVLMFGVFFVLFLKDWKVGWPKKNEVYYTYKAFEKAKAAFEAHETAEGTPEAWTEYVGRQKIGLPDGEGMLPSGVAVDSKWPEILADYERFKKSNDEESKLIPPLWAEYTDERGWSSAVPKTDYKQEKIKAQLYYGLGSGALLAISLFFLIRTSRRMMKVDEEAYYAPSGERILFGSIRKVDKRKWETKGLAFLYYQAGDGEESELKKTKVDGMVYGQFKKEDGAPAEALFTRILENFAGELIELEDDEDESEAEEEGAGPEEDGEDLPDAEGEESQS